MEVLEERNSLSVLETQVNKLQRKLCAESETFPGYNIEAPSNVKVQQGLCAHIPCSFTYNKNHGSLSLPDNKVLWFKCSQHYTSPVVIKNIDSILNFSIGRIWITGDVQNGDCSLSINNVELEDADTYCFRIEGTSLLQFSYTGITPSVSVTELTEKPQIFSHKPLNAGEEVTLLTCTAPGRCAGTAPIITWEGNVNYPKYETSRVDHGDGNSTHYSVITFTPTERDNNRPLTCKVAFGSIRTLTTRNTITLNVECNGDVKNVRVLEGGSVILQCNVISNPTSSIIWLKNHKVLNSTESGHSLMLHLDNISSVFPVYTCSASNIRGKTRTDIYITVECNVLQGNAQELDEGSSFFMKCTAESSPPAAFYWLQPNHNVSEGHEINVNGLLETDYGLYMCKATNKYGTSSISVNIIRKSSDKEGGHEVNEGTNSVYQV
ncbi:sialic acid-binding Ig-like lectin 14 [Bombina bombina]|uniref:sialic acid-binding Ig-like lectin 14 n=1 Tax=Bombina bombina TaxID=8345 RepID=UPI00235B2AB3|nr:sialic acid-binding Ig-like lectin 14 [Bombina bombina]